MAQTLVLLPTKASPTSLANPATFYELYKAAAGPMLKAMGSVE